MMFTMVVSSPVDRSNTQSINLSLPYILFLLSLLQVYLSYNQVIAVIRIARKFVGSFKRMTSRRS